MDSDVGHLPLDLDVLRYNVARILGDVAMPENYAVLDLETTGFSPKKSKIWQIGFYIVRDGKPWAGNSRGLSYLVKTTEADLLKNRFEIERIAEARMKAFPETTEQAIANAEEHYLHRFFGDEKPVERAVAVKEAARFLEMCMEKGYPIVGHGLAAFDVPFFEHECVEQGVSFRFPDANVIDTGMLIKAAEIPRRVLDTEYYRPMAFYKRIRGERRRGALYALDRFCLPYWRLDLKYGVNMEKAHDAGYDCWVTSLVLQELINTANGAKVGHNGVSGHIS